jgi:hypothetical protein
LRPVFISPAADLVGSPPKLDAVHAHAGRAPDLDEVVADVSDLREVAAHLVVHQRKPVRYPEDERAAGREASVHVHGLENALRDVHAPARLKAVVEAEAGLLVLEEQLPELPLRLAARNRASCHRRWYASAAASRRLPR